MGKFGWDYPPGCHSLPWDNEEEDERCAFARWVDRWLGTAQTDKQHWLNRGGKREVVGWTYTLTVLWVYHLYFYWRDSKQFSVNLSLLKAGQHCRPDEQEAQLQLKVSTNFEWKTLNRVLEVELWAAPPPILEQCSQSNTETWAPRMPLWQHTFLLEERQDNAA